MKLRFEPSITVGTVTLTVGLVIHAIVFYTTTNYRLDAHDKLFAEHQKVLDTHELKIDDIKETLSAIKESNMMMSDWMRRAPSASTFKPPPPEVNHQ